MTELNPGNVPEIKDWKIKHGWSP